MGHVERILGYCIAFAVIGGVLYWVAPNETAALLEQLGVTSK